MLFTRLSSLHYRGRHRAALRQLSSKLERPGSSRFHVPSRGRQQLLMGCVSYDPAVSDIWIGIQSYLNRAMTAGGSEPFDFCLFTNYPAQVRALLDGHIDIAWNGPIAHVMAERGLQMASAGATTASADSLLSLGMRDVDRDFRSVLVTRTSLSIRSVQQLQDRLLLAGSWDSPQANVVPLYWLRVLKGVQPKIIEYNVDVGKHGDTAAGEVMLLKDLCVMASSGSEEGAAGAVLSKMMWDRAMEGRLDGVDPALLSEHYEIMVGAQIPVFDHCQFDAIYNPDKIELFEDFSSALMQMDMNDPEQQRLMCLEGINKEWVPPRQEGYDIIRKAINADMGASSSNNQTATNLFTAKSCFLLNQRGTQSFRQQTQQFRSFSSTASGMQPISHPKTIAVIGAGVAGLQTTRALQSHGFHVTCFDANSKVGGLWNSNYANFGVQVPKQLYEVQDFPMTEVKEGEYPSAVQVQKYLERMVKEFRLQDSIELNTCVESVDQNEDGTWEVSIKHLHGDKSTSSQERRSFDYLISATGLYSNRDAFLPSDIEGRDKYLGRILHSSEFTDASVATGRRVIVVGGGKSAIDCAVEAHRAGAAKVTLLSRKAHWPTPRKIAGVIPFQYVFLSRFGTALVSAHRGVYPDEGTGKAVTLFRKFGWPIVGGAFYAVEALFRLQLRLFGERSPKADVVEDFYGYAHVLNSDLQDLIKSKLIDFKIGEISRFLGDSSIELSTSVSSTMDANLIVFATGFKPNYSMFAESIVKDLNIESDGLYLYRQILPPHVRNLAFIGKAATISNISSYGIQAEWLARMLNGVIPQPNISTMESEIVAHKEWSRAWMPPTSSRASLILLHQTHYHDALLRDMGENPLRKSNIFEEYFGPYQPRDYDGIMASPPGAATLSV